MGIKNGKGEIMNTFFSEILEQPTALKNTLEFYTDLEGKGTLENIRRIFKEKEFEYIIFTGMGSSYFTSYAVSNLFNSFGMKSFVINTSELLHYNFSVLNDKTLLVCISQSGESYEIKEILKIIPSNVFCIGITNEENSTLAEISSIVLLSKAGKEDMTSTKTYVSTSLVSFIMGWLLAGKWNDDKINLIKNLIENIKTGLSDYNSRIIEILKFLGEIPFLQIIARGPSYSSALQSALMFKEGARTPSAGILGGEFRHGPMEMVQEGFKSILFAPNGKTISQSIQMAKDIAGFSGKVLLITNINPGFSNNNIRILNIPESNEYLFSINSIIPIQLLVDCFAKSKGFEAGRFIYGAKITEEE